jgi:hypothetical protein
MGRGSFHIRPLTQVTIRGIELSESYSSGDDPPPKRPEPRHREEFVHPPVSAAAPPPRPACGAPPNPEVASDAHDPVRRVLLLWDTLYPRQVLRGLWTCRSRREREVEANVGEEEINWSQRFQERHRVRMDYVQGIAKITNEAESVIDRRHLLDHSC